MQDVLRIIINLVSLLINIGLAYFAVRLMQVFKGGYKEKPLRHICAGVLTVAVSSSFFSLYYFLRLPSYFQQVGAIVAAIGGGLVLEGLYEEYRLWTSAK